jgi:hypothetical protein
MTKWLLKYMLSLVMIFYMYYTQPITYNEFMVGIGIIILIPDIIIFWVYKD